MTAPLAGTGVAGKAIAGKAVLGKAVALIAWAALAGSGCADRPNPPAAVWLPDTATVLYTAAPDGDAELFARRGRGGEPVDLTRHAGQDHWGSWSPDGTRILFQTLRDGNREVYVAAADGSDPVNLTRHEAEDLLPEWAPDGTRVLFFSDRGVARGPNGELAGNLWVMGADGSDPRRVTRVPLSSTYAGAWAPDARSIVFAREVDGDAELHALDLASGEERRLLERPGADGGPRFSPDGSWIAFHAQDGAASRIAVVAADGTGLRFLTGGALHYNPTWSPDGRWILFSGAPLGGSVNDLLVVSLEGGDVEALVAGPGDERLGRWAPAGPAPTVR